MERKRKEKRRWNEDEELVCGGTVGTVEMEESFRVVSKSGRTREGGFFLNFLIVAYACAQRTRNSGESAGRSRRLSPPRPPPAASQAGLVPRYEQRVHADQARRGAQSHSRSPCTASTRRARRLMGMSPSEPETAHRGASASLERRGKNLQPAVAVHTPVPRGSERGTHSTVQR